jgi:chromosome segregation ATPase
MVMPLSLPVAAQSGQGKGKEDQIPPGAVYRFTDEDGNTEISSSLSDEAIEQGYEILNRKGMVIKEVAPALTEEERQAIKERKQRQRQKERQDKRDEKLLRLYAGPEDARRARDRQIKALEVNISYTRNSLQQVRQKLDQEVSSAAKFERRGDQVPPSIQDSIDHYQSKIQEYKNEIAEYQQDIKDVRKRFRPIIERLKVIAPEGDDRGKTAAKENGEPDSLEEDSVSIPSPAPEPDTTN